MLIPGDARSVPVAATTADRFSSLYKRDYPRVFAFAYRRTGDRTWAEDVTAQTFLQALQAFHRYEDRGVPVTAWLLRIAAHVVANHIRRRRPVLLLGDAAVLAPADRFSVQDGLHDWVERQDRAAWLAAHLATLPAAQRQVLRLYYGEDRPVAEVAARIGRSEAATKQLLHRTVKTLRERMQQDVAGAGLRL